MNPYFSIIIPTLNRASTLKYCLQTIAIQEFDDYEVIVSDNCSEDETASVVNEARKNNPRIRYITPASRLSMSRHWEFAYAHANGNYVCYLGDDDAIVLGGLASAHEILQQHGMPVAINSVNVEYHWQNSPIKFHQSILRVPLDDIWVQKRDSRRMLELLRLNIRLYVELPMVYRGFVRREILNSLKQRTGDLIRSSIPDVYLAIAVAATTDEYLYTNQPLFVEGVSGASNGAAVCAGALNTDKEFFISDSIPFHRDLDFCVSTAFLHAESLLQCRDYGLLKNEHMMTPHDIISGAAPASIALIPDRYQQWWNAIMKVAESNQLLDLANTLKAHHPNRPDVKDPFPQHTFWTDSRNIYDPCLAIRSDRFECDTIFDCVQLLGTWGKKGLGGTLLRELAEHAYRLDRQISIQDEAKLYCSSPSINGQKIPTSILKSMQIFREKTERELTRVKRKLNKTTALLADTKNKLQSARQEREEIRTRRSWSKKIKAFLKARFSALF